MTDNNSSSSYAVSAIEFNSRSLNPLSNVNAGTLMKVKREADSFISCSKKCSLIWAALSKNEMAGNNLTEKVLEGVFGQYQQDLYAFTKLPSLRDFMRVFDADKDGCLNPDEQISIFLFIKKKVELAASNCLHLQQYIRFEALMREVRAMEGCIAVWQNQLREKVHLQQIGQYKKEGENRVDSFCTLIQSQFEALEMTMVSRREMFQQRALIQQQQLQERLSSPEEYLKIKPANRLKELQFQEKLVSLEERVYEALDFRKQLNQLEVKEKNKIDTLMEQHAERQRNALNMKHQKQRRQLQIKLRELEDKLIIKAKNQFQVLRKKNNLHEIEIRRLQGLQKKIANKRAIEQPQLQRTKMFKRQRNQVLQQFKKSILSSNAVSEESFSAPSGKMNAKSLLHSGLQIKICDKPEQAVNKVFNRSTTNDISKYITSNDKDRNYSLCKMYDSRLEPLPHQPFMTQTDKMNASSKKYQFVINKIGNAN